MHINIHALCRHTLISEAEKARRAQVKRHNREIRSLIVSSLLAL